MSKIKEGCYIDTRDIPDTETWKRVIDKFVEAGFNEDEGYTENCYIDYDDCWDDWNYVGIISSGDIRHANVFKHYGTHHKSTQLSLEDILRETERSERITFADCLGNSHVFDLGKVTEQDLKKLYNMGYGCGQRNALLVSRLYGG